jgi:hypothetical protein
MMFKFHKPIYCPGGRLLPEAAGSPTLFSSHAPMDNSLACFIVHRHSEIAARHLDSTPK